MSDEAGHVGEQSSPAIQRIVVKVGSAVVAPGGVVDSRAIERIAAGLAGCRRDGVEVVLVSSGAVASGFRALGLKAMPAVIREKQAAAAIGQPALVARYAARLVESGLAAAQVLLTADDFGDRARFLNARHTVETLLARGVVPIINENDSVVFDEIKLGDNDRLSALVACAIDADLLVMLSAAGGLRDGGTGAIIPEVASVADAERHVRDDASSVGTGGMATKLEAVRVCAEHGIPVHLGAGPTDEMADPIGAALGSGAPGTRFSVSGGAGTGARKSWIAHAAGVKGRIVVDHGAVRAVVERGASLLPGGVRAVEGRFDSGAPVEIADEGGVVIARGLSSYASHEIERIKGRRSAEIEGVLGYAYADEVVHRNDMQVSKGAR